MKAIHTKYDVAESMEFPGVLTLKVLLTGEQTNGAWAIFEDIVKPGIGAPLHIHHEQDETFFFLKGQFQVHIDGEIHEMSEGDVALIPKGTVHAFKNVGEQEGVIRYAFSPAQNIEEMFRSFYKASLEGGLSDEEMNAIALKHGQEIVGPPF